jgi:RES domain-containing protein
MAPGQEMTLWRISRHDELDGWGGEKADGRWHTAAKGKRIVYLSEHPAVALVEELGSGVLGEDWRSKLEKTRRIGDAWLERRSSALLRVPSAPSPESWNYLLNPLHAEARETEVEWARWVEYDRRLFHLEE